MEKVAGYALHYYNETFNQDHYLGDFDSVKDARDALQEELAVCREDIELEHELESFIVYEVLEDEDGHIENADEYTCHAPVYRVDVEKGIDDGIEYFDIVRKCKR